MDLDGLGIDGYEPMPTSGVVEDEEKEEGFLDRAV